ncbi:MAG: protein-L-isoaspartate O-methyltransferase [Alphaproteobacteria bacterium]|nr:MAG: protein-L-isoaspartate O-methyltransferase [Alphaproteobacteria bacterium]
MIKKSEIKKKINLILELQNYGIEKPDILKVMEEVDRQIFVEESLRKKAYDNIALPIDCGQTISQPLVVALMTQFLDLKKNMRVLEIGTGSGYQTFILSKLARFIYTIERHKFLYINAYNLFKKLMVTNIFCKHDDGGLGWKDQAPFDRIIVTASAPDIPSKLIEQLSINGKMIIPIGDQHNDQVLKKISKNGETLSITDLGSVRFVPLLEGKENK